MCTMLIINKDNRLILIPDVVIRLFQFNQKIGISSKDSRIRSEE